MALEFCSVEDRSFDAKEFSRDENGRRIHHPAGQSPHLADRTTRRPRKNLSGRRRPGDTGTSRG